MKINLFNLKREALHLLLCFRFCRFGRFRQGHHPASKQALEQDYYDGPDPIPEQYFIQDSELLKFMREGHIFVEKLFDASMIENHLLPSLKKLNDDNELISSRHAVRVVLGMEGADDMTIEECRDALSNVDSDAIPFLQLFNLWRSSQAAQAVASSPYLGYIASELLGCGAVRLYQDSLFVKRSSDGPTRWHSDLTMAPFDCNDMVTCWIPLQPVPPQAEGGSSLTFATGSHRDFALPFWSDPTTLDLEGRYEVVTYEGFEVGDCSFHHGWCLHSAPGNELPATRFAYAVTFIADGAKLLDEEGHLRYPDSEDYQSYADWIEEIGWGGRAVHPLTPLVFAAEDYEPPFTFDDSAVEDEGASIEGEDPLPAHEIADES